MITFDFIQATISHYLKDPHSKSLEPDCLSPFACNDDTVAHQGGQVDIIFSDNSISLHVILLWPTKNSGPSLPGCRLLLRLHRYLSASTPVRESFRSPIPWQCSKLKWPRDIPGSKI